MSLRARKRPAKSSIGKWFEKGRSLRWIAKMVPIIFRQWIVFDRNSNCFFFCALFRVTQSACACGSVRWITLFQLNWIRTTMPDLVDLNRRVSAELKTKSYEKRNDTILTPKHIWKHSVCQWTMAIDLHVNLSVSWPFLIPLWNRN